MGNQNVKVHRILRALLHMIEKDRLSAKDYIEILSNMGQPHSMAVDSNVAKEMNRARIREIIMFHGIFI